MQSPLHPLQSNAWKSFRESMGTSVVSVSDGFNMSIHPLPAGIGTIGYIPKCPIPTDAILNKINVAAKKHACIFVKIEPDALATTPQQLSTTKYRLYTSPHPNFYHYSFIIDLIKSEQELLRQMKSKTRYNIRVAQKHGVRVKEDNSPEAFEQYISLSKKTWHRKGFLGHGETYHRNMWKYLHNAGIAHLLIATYNNKPLTAWIVFLYNNTLYYPYGASSDEHKHTMASNLMMWEAIKWGKKHGATTFDLWGCLGPDPDKTHPWYGFHKFKEGYGGKLVEYIGSYDLVTNPLMYRVYNILHPIRQKLLGLSD